MCWYLFSSLRVCGWVALSELLCTAMTDMYPTRSQSEAQSLWSYIASNRILINWSSRARESDFLLLSVSEPLLSALWLVCPASTVQLQLQECQLSTKYLIEWHGSGSCNRRLQELVPPARFLRYLSLPWLPWSKFYSAFFREDGDLQEIASVHTSHNSLLEFPLVADCQTTLLLLDISRHRHGNIPQNIETLRGLVTWRF